MAMRWLMRQRCERGSALSSKRSIIVGRSSFATEIPKEKAAPLLMLSSPTNPEYRYFFDVDKESIKFNRKIHLPQIAGHHCIGSSEGFLLSIPICWSPPIHATNPFDDASQLPIPSTSSLRPVDGIWSSKAESYNAEDCWKTKSGKIIALDYNFGKLFQSKAIISSSKDIIVLLRNGVADYALSISNNSVWMPITSLVSSSMFDHTIVKKPFGVFNDCIFHNNFLYVSNYRGNLAIVDLDNPLAPPLSCLDSPLSEFTLLDHYRKSLVESPDGKDLFLLERKSNWMDDHLYRGTLRFVVYKLDKDNFKWNKLDSIGDLVMFIGINSSICLSATDFSNLKPNSIYFTDHVHRFDPDVDPDVDPDMGVYDLEQGTIHRFNLTYDGQEKLTRPHSIWFLPAQTCI